MRFGQRRTASAQWASTSGTIAGSTDRLITYLEGKELSIVQMAQIAAEHEPGETREKLLAPWTRRYVLRALDPAETRTSAPKAVAHDGDRPANPVSVNETRQARTFGTV
jgi:hypothetical protein